MYVFGLVLLVLHMHYVCARITCVLALLLILILDNCMCVCFEEWDSTPGVRFSRAEREIYRFFPVPGRPISFFYIVLICLAKILSTLNGKPVSDPRQDVPLSYIYVYVCVYVCVSVRMAHQFFVT